MTTLSEGDLRLTLPGQVAGRKFDGAAHRLSHCGLKAVDWILELPGRIYFVEVKDPEAPGAKEHKQSNHFLQGFLAGSLTPDLVAKFRDSFLYEWACDRTGKPISYCVIVASGILDDAQLLTRTDDLKRMLPVGAPADWTRPIAHDCYVVNVAKWNEVFPQYPLSRDSATGSRAS